MAKEAVEAIRKKLYPDLFNAKDDDTGTTAGLKPIQETDTDKDDTVTEDCTSEAFGDSEDDDEDDGKPRTARDEDDEELGDDDDDEDDDFDADLEALAKPAAPEKTFEDIEFEKEFERMATESFLERLKEPAKVNTKDIPVPITMRSSGTKKTYEQLQVSC